MPPTDAALDPAGLDDLVESCQRMLMALSEKGMALVRAIDPHDESMSMGEKALAFERLSRSIRLNILLSQRLRGLAQGGLAALAAERAPAPAEPETDVPDPAEREAAEPRERGDRLDRESPDPVFRLIRRPLPEAVAVVCEGLGLSAEETAEAQAPFEALVANDDGPHDPPTRSAGVSPAPAPLEKAGDGPPRPRSSLKARLLGGTTGLGGRALGP
jgi:hypothetical protein